MIKNQSPQARFCSEDTRLSGYAAYGELELQPVTHRDGDSYSRCAVRCEEIFQSIDLNRQALDKLPSSEIAIKFTGNPKGEVAVRTEQPRGEGLYYLKANGTKHLRFRVRTPTFANLPALLKVLQGCDLADVPVLVLNIDPCISCTER